MTELSDRARAAARLPSRIGSRVPAPILCLIGLAIVTLYFTRIESAETVSIYDSVLLTCIGAVAIQVLQGTAGLVSVGSAAFLLVGGFVAVAFLRAGVPFPVDVLAATVAAGLAGLLTGLPALRLRALFLALATLATRFIAQFVGSWYQSRIPGLVDTGFFVPVLFGGAGIAGSVKDWAWLLTPIVALSVIAGSRVMKYRSGRALRMMRDHEIIAPAMGIPVARYKLLIFCTSSAAFGFVGAMTAHFTGQVVTDNYTLAVAFQYVAMIIIGGLDSVAGAVIGAAVIIALPSLIPSIVGGLIGGATAVSDASNISLVVYGVLVIIFATASPGGIVGLVSAARGKIVRQISTKAPSRVVGAAPDV